MTQIKTLDKMYSKIDNVMQQRVVLSIYILVTESEKKRDHINTAGQQVQSFRSSVPTNMHKRFDVTLIYTLHRTLKEISSWRLSYPIC